jgi:hypothetical protein
MSKRKWCISLFLSNSNVQHYLVVGESREESIVHVVNRLEREVEHRVVKVISKPTWAENKKHSIIP